MNLPQAKILLEKIISLYKTMSNDEKNISPIERDLMMSYIRQLYESFLEANNAESSTRGPSVSAQPITTKVVQTPPPPPRVEVVKPSPPPPPIQHTVVVEAPKPPVVEPPRIVEPPRVVVSQPPPPPVVERPRHNPSVFAAGNAEIEALFHDSTGRELSDRLSNTPITDLTKAFGLNDRLLTQNELFSGGKVVFDEALKDLNNSSSFDTAKAMLIDLATRYNWTATEDRKKQAKSFIKLVKRRFSM
jgi:hypothetical protein